MKREQLRELVELYHQAENFITHENLEKRIDDAFGLRSTMMMEDEMTGEELRRRLLRRRTEAVYTTQKLSMKAMVMNPRGEGGRRMRQAVAALWGTATNGSAGLEIVEEYRAEVDASEAAEAELGRH